MFRLKLMFYEYQIESSRKVCEERAHAVVSNLAQSVANRSEWKTWRYACFQPTPFRLTDLEFVETEASKSDLSEFYFTQNLPSDADDRRHRCKFVNPRFISDEDFYDSRIRELGTDGNSAVLGTAQIVHTYMTGRQVNDELMKRVGVKAEHFVCRYLKYHYGEAFDEFESWVSSAAHTVYPGSAKRFDDSLGYDFKLTDYKWLLVSDKCKADKSEKVCFVEVKGCADAWDGTFHISKNEVRKKDEVNKDIEAYVVVVVENVLHRDMIRIAKIIDWTNEPALVQTQPESFLARVGEQGRTGFDPPMPLAPNRGHNQLSGPEINNQSQSRPQRDRRFGNQAIDRPHQGATFQNTNRKDKDSRKSAKRDQNDDRYWRVAK